MKLQQKLLVPRVCVGTQSAAKKAGRASNQAHLLSDTADTAHNESRDAMQMPMILISTFLNMPFLFFPTQRSFFDSPVPSISARVLGATATVISPVLDEEGL